MIRFLLLGALFACNESTLEDGGTSSDARPDTGSAIDAAPMDASSLDASAMDASPMDADPIDADAIDAADPIDADTTDASDAGTRDCATIEAEYQAIVARIGCIDSTECQVVNGHCATGLGGCWYVVNATVMQADLDALATEYTNLGCTSGVCRCTAPPANTTCDQNLCQPL